MAKLDIHITHSLTEAEALKRIKKLIEKEKKEHGYVISDLKQTWSKNKGHFSVSAKGYPFSGTITVSAPDIHLEGEIPWSLSFMKGKIEKLIRSNAASLLKK